MKRTVLALFLLIAILQGCTSKDTDEQNGIIVFDNNKEYPLLDLKLSDIADIEFVQLKDEDSALLISPLLMYQYIGEEFIIIADKIPGSLSLNDMNVYMYDRQGNYIRTLCRGGRGPGEMPTQPARIMVQPDSNKIIIATAYTGGKILQYDYSGNLIYSATPHTTYSEAAIVGNYILLHFDLSQSVSKDGISDRGFPPLNIVDATTFVPVPYDTLKYERVHNFNGTTESFFPNLIYAKDGIYVNSLRSDTIRFIDKNLNIIPRVVTKGYLPDRFRGIAPLVDMDDYILFKSQSNAVLQKENPLWQHYIYLKKEKKLYRIPWTDTKEKQLKNEIYLTFYTYTANYDKHVYFLSYDNIQEYYYQYLPKDIQAIADTMTEDSNPLMMIIKFRPLGRR